MDHCLQEINVPLNVYTFCCERYQWNYIHLHGLDWRQNFLPPVIKRNVDQNQIGETMNSESVL